MKVFNLSTKALKGSLSIGFDIQRIAVSSDYIFTLAKNGSIEVWLNDSMVNIASIKTGQAKITSLVSDPDGGMLYASSSDGKIQVLSLGPQVNITWKPNIHSIFYFWMQAWALD